jgi:hypothetical protein
MQPLKTAILKNQIQGLRTCDGERKNGNFGGKMGKLEKVRYGSNARRKRWKAHKYWGFEVP